MVVGTSPWSEPRVRVTADGRLDRAEDLLQVDQFRLEGGAVTCDVGARVTRLAGRRDLTVEGQLHYDLEKLAVRPMETVHDLPDGDWRRVQKADGYRYTIVNGEVTFEDGVCSGALPGKVLRSYDQVPG